MRGVHKDSFIVGRIYKVPSMGLGIQTYQLSKRLKVKLLKWEIRWKPLTSEKKEDQWISYQPLLTNSADFMPLKMQKDTSGGGGKGGVVEGIKKNKFSICCHAVWNILLGTNWECKAVSFKDASAKARTTQAHFSFLQKWQYSGPPTVEYDKVFLGTEINMWIHIC